MAYGSYRIKTNHDLLRHLKSLPDRKLTPEETHEVNRLWWRSQARFPWSRLPSPLPDVWNADDDKLFEDCMRAPDDN